MRCSENAEHLETDDHDQRHTAEPKNDAFHEGLSGVDMKLSLERRPEPAAGENKPPASAGAYIVAYLGAARPGGKPVNIWSSDAFSMLAVLEGASWSTPLAVPRQSGWRVLPSNM